MLHAEPQLERKQVSKYLTQQLYHNDEGVIWGKGMLRHMRKNVGLALGGNYWIGQQNTLFYIYTAPVGDTNVLPTQRYTICFSGEDL